jgi:hypothetical protein
MSAKMKVLDAALNAVVVMTRSPDVSISLAATEEMKFLAERRAELLKDEQAQADRPKAQRELQLGGAR